MLGFQGSPELLRRAVSGGAWGEHQGFSHERVRAGPYRDNQRNPVINGRGIPYGWPEEIPEEPRGASTRDVEAASAGVSVTCPHLFQSGSRVVVRQASETTASAGAVPRAAAPP